PPSSRSGTATSGGRAPGPSLTWRCTKSRLCPETGQRCPRLRARARRFPVDPPRRVVAPPLLTISSTSGGTMERRQRFFGAGYWCVRSSLALAAVLALASLAHAEEALKVDSGDNAWMLTSSALVLMMTAPGLALFYGGLVRKVIGALDFAGGTVVHISSGTSALLCAVVLGKRLGYGSEPMPAHNMPFVLTGAALLWVGWFGFDAGSALAANALATSAFVATNTATAAASLSWMLAEWFGRGKPTILGAASGAVAGLVAITPASGFVAPMPALVIGAVAGVLCYGACNLKTVLGWYDDALDVVGVHGVGGSWGALATGLWASAQVNPAAFKAGGGYAVSEGVLISGQWGLFGCQVVAVLVIYVLAVAGSLLCLAITGVVTGGLRVSEDDEFAGLDLSQHSES